MALNKLVVTWSSFVGAPGYSVFYMLPSASQAPFGTFFGALAPYLPLNLVTTVPNNGEVIDETTGKMTNVWSNGTQVATTGTGGSAYAPSNGALVRWGTGTFRNGRRVLGHTFLVPLSTSAYAAGGILASSTANAIQAAADTLRSSLGVSLVVYNRPVYKKAPVEGDPPTLVRQGAYAPVTFTAVPTKAATLTPRRDI